MCPLIVSLSMLLALSSSSTSILTFYLYSIEVGPNIEVYEVVQMDRDANIEIWWRPLLTPICGRLARKRVATGYGHATVWI